MASCTSCTAAIIWAVSEKGHRMPVDKDPTPSGNIELRDVGGDTPVAVVHGKNDPPWAGDRFVSHFATCPRARDHRR